VNQAWPTEVEFKGGQMPDSANGIWNQEMETMPRPQLAALQDERLRSQFSHVWTNSLMLREKYREAGLDPRKFAGVDDLVRVPTLAKDDLRARRDATGDIFGGAACVDRARLSVVNHSSGTSGRPTVFGMTDADLAEAGEMFARTLYSIGLRAGDRTPVAGTTFWHGYVIGFEVGIRIIGAQAYRIACGTGDCVKEFFERWADADFTAMRTYIPELELPYLESNGIRPWEVFPKARFVYAGFDVSSPKRALIERAWGMPFRNTMGSGDQYLVGAECAHSAPYFHVPEDNFIFEVIDPRTGQQALPGDVGELVITNLWADGCPYLRYRMEDMVTYRTDPCACGRTTMRLRLLGRLAWSVLLKERRIFSTEVEEALWAEPELLGVPYQLVQRASQPQAFLEVRLDAGSNRQINTEVAAQILAERLGVQAKVALTSTVIGLKGPNKLERVIRES
jgi:phenylacetate-CoA ligase